MEMKREQGHAGRGSKGSQEEWDVGCGMWDVGCGSVMGGVMCDVFVYG
jgi:hypothetical protein